MSGRNKKRDAEIRKMREIDALCDEFERALNEGRQPVINEFLERCPGDAHEMLFQELLTLQLAHADTDETDRKRQATEEANPIYASTVSHADGEKTTAPQSPEQRQKVVSTQFRDRDSIAGYEILNEISRGGMGVVYRARQTKANRVVALKTIITGDLATKEEVNRFRTEAEAAANLVHPNIVPIFEVGDAGGAHFFSMGLIEGESLSKRLRRGPLEAGFVVQLMVKISAAVAYAHQCGIIHRDLKPGNILLNEDDEPFVSDFGLAKRIETNDQFTATGQILGTPSFMPPEQALARPEIDARADVYSLGALLYAMLTGRPPFQSASIFDTLALVVNEEPVAPRLLNPKVDLDLETICLKCLEKDPVKRYETAQALHEELERCATGVPIEARPVSRMERNWRWCKRNPAIASMIAAIAFVLIMGASVSSVFATLAVQRATRAEELLVEKDGLIDEKETLLTEKDRLLITVRREREVANTSRYGLQIQESNLAIANEEYDHAQELLDQTDPNQRGWEFGFLRSKLNEVVRTLEGHNERVGCVAYDIHSNLIASGDIGGEIKLWNSETKAVVASFHGHDDGVLAMAFSPNGELLATSGADSNITIWRTGDWQPQRTWPLPTMSMRIQFTPNNQRLVSACGDHLVRIWNIADEEADPTELKGHQGNVRTIAVSRDGKFFVSAGDDAVIYLWDLESGQFIKKFAGHQRSIWTVDISDDNQQIVSGALDNFAIVWDVQAETATTKIRHVGPVFDARFHFDNGKIITASYDGNVRIWNASDGELISNFVGHTAPSFCLALDSKSKRIFSGSWDQTLRIWNGEEEKRQNVFKLHNADIVALTVNSDGSTFAAASEDGEISIGDVNSDREVYTWKGHSRKAADICYRPNGDLIATAGDDGIVKIWNSDGESVKAFEHFKNPVHCIAFSPDGQSLFAGETSGQLSATDFASGKTQWRTEVQDSPINDIAVSKDGALIASAGANSRIHVWNSKTAKHIAEFIGHSDEVQCVAFRSDGKRLVSGSKDRTIKIWNLETVSLESTMVGHADWVNSVRWFANDRRVVSGSSDFTLRVWEPVTGQALIRIGSTQRSISDIDAEITDGHAGRIWAVAVAFGERSILSCGTDRTVRAWSNIAQ